MNVSSYLFWCLAIPVRMGIPFNQGVMRLAKAIRLSLLKSATCFSFITQAVTRPIQCNSPVSAWRFARIQGWSSTVGYRLLNHYHEN